MSDFLTRLVERQVGAAAIIQPRKPSMFAPTMSRPEPADLPLSDRSTPVENTRHTFATLIRSRDQEGEGLTHPAQVEGRQTILNSRSARRDAQQSRKAESVLTPLLPNASVFVRPSAPAVPTTPPADSLTIPEQRVRQQTGSRGQNIDDHVDSAPILAVTRTAPPPLVHAHQNTGRSSTVAPPSLRSSPVSARRAEQNHAAPIEPPVEVTIGRIEVTAVSTPPEAKRKSESRRPAMSLEEYLTRRQGGRL
ncbi:MAG: hypothetical protein ABS70_03105 [Nitrospira sp. SCN 59-13]|nr:MAG: hypothetical protein ABS70_03105 [Nitrospira sp. SCN 59-13]